MLPFDDPEHPCRFGNLSDERTEHHCAACTAECDRLGAAYDAAVAAGILLQSGHTPAEWRAAQRRQQTT